MQKANCTGTIINLQVVGTATLVNLIGLCTRTAKTRAVLRSLWPHGHYQEDWIIRFRPTFAQHRFHNFIAGPLAGIRNSNYL
jgi:hypothetical protein